MSGYALYTHLRIYDVEHLVRLILAQSLSGPMVFKNRPVLSWRTLGRPYQEWALSEPPIQLRESQGCTGPYNIQQYLAACDIIPCDALLVLGCNDRIS